MQTWKEILTDPEMSAFWAFMGMVVVAASIMGAWVFSMIWNNAAWNAM